MNSTTFQKTLNGEATLSGRSLFSGRECAVVLRPAPENHGIQFIRRDLPGNPRILSDPSNLAPSNTLFHCTALSENHVSVFPVEHFMAALQGLGISNLLVITDQDELPFFDGSSQPILETLSQVGVRSQDAPMPEIILKNEMRIENGIGEIQLFPSDRLRIEYHLEHTPPIGVQKYSFDYSQDAFIEEIAPARTFCTEAEARQFITRGGKGGTLENCLVFGKEGLLKGALRFPEEPARHKILDLFGDLALLRKILKARIVAKRSGHRLNASLIQTLKKNFAA